MTVESLYPFLYDGPSTAGVLEAVSGSTARKAAEILDLRELVGSRYRDALLACASAMADRFAAGGRLYCFGNGGSSSDAQAVTQAFCRPPEGARPLPAIGLTNDVAALTALANDIGFEVVFARLIAAFARPEDIALGLSTSGGSANVLRAFEEARAGGLLTVGFAGYDGGSMAASTAIDHLFVIPSSSVHRIQEAQTTLYDVLWRLVQHALG
jgi:D-sedoheptulose 7-phosphate isomerase